MWKHILFDLDGTLTDPAEGITGAVRHAMLQLGFPVPPQQVLEGFIGPPLDEIFPEVCGFDEATTAEAIRLFREYFARFGIAQNKIYPGIPALLQSLGAAGRTLHIATSKPTVFARQVLESFDITPHFDVVVGSGLEHAGRPKAEVVREVLDTARIGPGMAVMVGDRRHDVVGAHQNGLPCVGVLFGYGGPAELAQAGADYTAADVLALGDILLGH